MEHSKMLHRNPKFGAKVSQMIEQFVKKQLLVMRGHNIKEYRCPKHVKSRLWGYMLYITKTEF